MGKWAERLGDADKVALGKLVQETKQEGEESGGRALTWPQVSSPVPLTISGKTPQCFSQVAGAPKAGTYHFC